MTTLLSISLIVFSVPLTTFLGVLVYFWHQGKKEMTAQNRGMFRFNDGKNVRYVDPIAVMMAFESHPQYLADVHPKLAANGNKEAFDIIIDAIKIAFSVVDYSDEKLPGLTKSEMIALWNTFYTWVDLQKKSTEYERIYAESMEQISNESGTPITNSTSDSGLTEKEELQNSR